MPTKIFTFDPLGDEGLEETERELDRLLNRGWKIVSSIGGNRSGRQGGRGPLRSESVVAASAPVSKDYIVLILHKRVEKANGSKPNENNISFLNDGEQAAAKRKGQDDLILQENNGIKETT
jgi:hypothetical protein